MCFFVVAESSCKLANTLCLSVLMPCCKLLLKLQNIAWGCYLPEGTWFYIFISRLVKSTLNSHVTFCWYFLKPYYVKIYSVIFGKVGYSFVLYVLDIIRLDISGTQVTWVELLLAIRMQLWVRYPFSGAHLGRLIILGLRRFVWYGGHWKKRTGLNSQQYGTKIISLKCEAILNIMQGAYYKFGIITENPI